MIVLTYSNSFFWVDVFSKKKYKWDEMGSQLLKIPKIVVDRKINTPYGQLRGSSCCFKSVIHMDVNILPGFQEA